MRLIASAVAVVAVAATAWGVRPSFQAELDVTNTVAAVDGAAYRISGKVTDRSVMGYDGTSVAASNLVFSETITGDVDAWMVTNVVFSNAIHVVMDVVYLPLNTTNLTLEFPIGVAALCSVTDNEPQYPEPPSSTGAEVSQHVLNQIRTYSFSIIPEGDKGLGVVVTNIIGNLDFVSNAAVQGATIVTGATASVTRSGTNLAIVVPSGGGGEADGGATNIAAGATDSYDAATRTLSWNTNAAGGGGTGDASLWYQSPARDRVTFDPIVETNQYYGAATYNQSNYPGSIGTNEWTDTAKALAPDDDPAVLALEIDQIGQLLVVTNFTLLGGTGAYVSAVTVHSRYEGNGASADGNIYMRYGTNVWADAHLVGTHSPPPAYDTYSDTFTFPAPVSRNDLADLEVGFQLVNGAAGVTGRVDALWVELVGADAWDIGNDSDGDFTFASGGATRLSVSTGGVVTATGYIGDGSTLTMLTTNWSTNATSSAYVRKDGTSQMTDNLKTTGVTFTNLIQMISGSLDGTNGVYWLSNGTNYWILFP